MDYYRFSISWARVLPDGDVSNVNERGIKYYNKLINRLLENGIEPMITMYHYDLPNALHKFGGLANPIFIDLFADYAHLLFERFGDRVKTWITFNEPYEFCIDGYGRGIRAPIVKANGVGEYLCADNVLKAHATAYHIYDKFYRKAFNGKIGITLNSMYFYSDKNNSEAVDRTLQFKVGAINFLEMRHNK